MNQMTQGKGVRHNFDSSSPIGMFLAELARLDASGFEGVRREIGEYLVSDVLDNIDHQRLFDDSSMPQSKAAQARGGKTLLERGHLRDSYTYDLTRSGVAVGSNLVYAAILHFGGKTSPHKITARPGSALKTPFGPRKSVNHPGSRFIPRPVIGLGPRQAGRIGVFLIAEVRALQQRVMAGGAGSV